VPVGLDQKPHIEVAREIARKCNHLYATKFPIPEFFNISGDYIPSLTGEGKMSKTVPGSYINLSDDLETIEKKVAKIPTDSGKGEIRELKENNKDQDLSYFDTSGQESKGVKSLMTLVELFVGQDTRKSFEADYQKDGLRYAVIKKELAKSIYQELQPIQERRRELAKQKDYLFALIDNGNQRARTVAEKTIAEVKKQFGLAITT
jgi:tryptophanyl-tRNA synthetase